MIFDESAVNSITRSIKSSVADNGVCHGLQREKILLNFIDVKASKQASCV